MIHSLNLLKHPLDLNFKLRAVETLRKCRNEDGGFGGGPGQASHLASTYAAVHCLCSLNLVEAYDVIDRKKLMKWMTALKQDDGSFCLSIGGEIDIRGLYCAISVLKLLNCDKLEFTEGEVTYTTKFLYNKSSEFIARCQTFDGGLGCYPGVEAHGGYVFCGLAAIRLLGDSHLLNMELLTKWAVQRQMEMEGGYQGRCNKLVDGCYCFWVGGAFPLLHLEEDIMNRKLLQKYILKACQSPYGGCRDKPGKGVDHYHTCYVLSGLSISQYKYNIDSRVQLSQGIPNWLFYKIEPTEETISLKDEPDQVLVS
jgi:protein farnesyltransferase subunit beta